MKIKIPVLGANIKITRVVSGVPVTEMPWNEKNNTPTTAINVPINRYIPDPSKQTICKH